MAAPAPAGPRRTDDLRDRIDVHLAASDAARDADEAERCRALIAPEERAGCETFNDEADRRSALVTRALVRTTLSRYAPVAAEAWRFARTGHGRPEIESPPATGLRFNVSHTREVVVCAVTLDADIGVDVERTTPHDDLPAVAPTVLAPGELDALRALPPERRVERFYAAWTLKESYLKARGLGLALSPRAVEFGFEEAGRVRVRFGPDAADDPSDWWFALLRAGSGHLLALSVRVSVAPEGLRLFRVSPGGGAPVRIDPTVLATSDRTRGT